MLSILGGFDTSSVRRSIVGVHTRWGGEWRYFLHWIRYDKQWKRADSWTNTNCFRPGRTTTVHFVFLRKSFL